MDEQEQEPMLAPVHDGDVLTTLARWSKRERGYIAVCNRLTGDVVEIPYRDATDVWKEDIRRLKPRPR